MFLRSRSVVRHSCSGLHTEAGWLLIRSESRERVNVFHQSPPPITMLTPDPSVCLRGRERGRNEGRGAALQEMKSMPWSKGREGRERERERSRCVQMFRWRGSEGRSSRIDSPRIMYCWAILCCGPLMSPLFMNIWAVNLSVQPQKVPLTAQCDFARPPALSVVFMV